MMAHNLCYTTLVTKESRDFAEEKDCVITPTSDRFVKVSWVI
jgi:hypothetical protein